jgi:ferric-dicitrate binding protein FerR (iron transport regulator)/TolA-binding protein
MRATTDELLVDAFVARAERDLGEISQEQLDGGWQRLRQARSAGARVWPLREGRRPRVLPWLAGFATASLVALLGLYAYRKLSPQPLRYQVEGLVAREGDAIATSPSEVSRLLFSDESRIALDVSTRLTVDGLDAAGARIGLLDGAIDVFVKPRANGSWRFAAGPFLVRVTGTAFRLAFAPSLGRFGLQMTTGHVEVLTPSGRTISVRAGESLELFATPPPPAGSVAQPIAPSQGNTTTAVSARPAWSHPRAAADSPRRRGISSAGEPSTAPAGAAGAPLATAPLAWTQWLSQGKFSLVVADAEQRGIDQIIAQARPADMAALADAARYIQRYSLSRQVLLAMRARFAATASANDASFFLGRLAEATSGAESALEWYDTYLREAPRGLYAKEAMGREMRLRAASERARARQIARQYLERFPQGSEAALAKSLVRSDTE